MTTPQDIQDKFWKALESDRVMMLGIDGVEDGHTRPMTGLVEERRGPIWFFTSTENAMIPLLRERNRVTATLSSKGHDVFASVHGCLNVDNDRVVVDRLWNPYVAAWFEGGKDDPKLVLLRLDAEHAEIWLNGSSIVAGVKMLFGVDPKEEYKDKVAQVNLR